MHGQIQASLLHYPTPVGRHPLMPPRIMRLVEERRSDPGIAPYAVIGNICTRCRKTAAPAAVLDGFG